MAVELSSELAELENDILRQPQEYEFFQAYRILSKINEKYPVSARRPPRIISVRPELGLGYSETDVSSVFPLEKDNGYEIVTQISGLYGLSSPLPDFYNEELLDNEWEEIHAPREFLDIVHSQLLPKLYHAWSLFKLNFNTFEHDRDSYWHMLYSLLGLVDSENDPLLAKLKLRYFGLFSKTERSSGGIKVITEDFLGIRNISIEEFVMRSVRIPESLQLQLGSCNHCLGDDAHLGNQIQDQNGCFRIHTGPLSEEKYRDITDKPSTLSTLSRLLSSYIRLPLTFDIVFQVGSASVPLTVGQQWHQLGVDSYLYDTTQAQPTRTIVHALA